MAILLWRPRGLFGRRLMAVRSTLRRRPGACSTPSRAGIASARFEALPWLGGGRGLFRVSRLSGAGRADPRHHPVRAVASIWCWAMPASSRSGTPPSSAPAPIRPGSSPPMAGVSRSAACCAAGARRRASGLSTGAIILRTTGLTLLMQTLVVAAMLYELANKAHPHHRRRRRIAGHGGVADLRRLPLRPVRPHRLHLLPRRAVPRLAGGAHDRLFALRPLADRHSRERRCACMRSARRSSGASSSSTRSRRRWPASPAR